MATQVEIARKLGLDVSSVNKILNRCKGPVFRRETVERVFRAARDLGYDFGRLKFRHRRRHPRRPFPVDAEIAVFGSEGKVYDRGRARIEDISAGGARVSRVSLPQGCLPLEDFRVSLRPLKRSLKSLELPGRIVRLTVGEGVGFGVSFEGLSDADRRRLEKVASN